MHSRAFSPVVSGRIVGLPFAALFLAACLCASQQPPSTPGKAPASHPAPKPASKPPEVHPIKEEDLRHRLQGKIFYLRGGYFDNDLRFDEEGRLTSGSTRASYTLSMVQIDKVSLSKHKLQLQGIRYGVHFLGAGPTEDPLTASVKVRITPKKKFFKITIERAQVVTPKKKKEKHSKDDLQPTAVPASAGEEGIARTQAHANQLLEQALANILAPGLDERMIASLPDFWKLYYQEAAAKTEYKPTDPSVLRQSTVDQKARLLTNFVPPSNDLAQAAGVAGVCMYHVVVGRDGKPAEIAVGRPIGFGLDESAVESIRKATFQPAMKGGQPVPVLVDMLVEFRIYSKRTALAGNDSASATLAEPGAPSLPGPYTANEPATKPQ